MIDTSEKQTQNFYIDVQKSGDTVVIDNGTFEIKAGYLNNLCIVAKNNIYKNKDKTSLDPFISSTVKTMFDGDVVVSFDVLEQTIDLVLEHLKASTAKNLIITSTPYSPTEEELLTFLFEVYKFDKIQIGYDFMYCYHMYFDKQDCVIIDLKYSSTIVCVVSKNQIQDIYKINFGGKDILNYINHCMIDKYKEIRRDYRGLVEFLHVADNYEDEVVAIYHEMCSGIYDHNIFLTDQAQYKVEPAIKKIKKVEKTANAIPAIDYELLNKADDELSKEQLKEKRRVKMIYCSTFARLKSKVESLFKELDNKIENLNDELEKQSNPKKYLQKKKDKFSDMKRTLELREQLRRDVKNKKTREFAIKFKEGILTDEEMEIKCRILEAEDEEQDNMIIANLETLAAEITGLDPEFIPFYANTVEILRGDNIGRQCVNIDLLKWPEIIFNPSIIGSEQMGLSEIFENIFPHTQIENVLLCGGFSFIKNLEGRIEKEIKRLLYSGNVNLVKAKNPQKDPFFGAKFSEYFPIHLRKDVK
ncbi:Nuclear actin-protein involved in chromatin remodeling [Glugoides intestinalis]